MVWQKCGEDSALARRFYVPGYSKYLPFFIYGEDVFRLEKGQNIELTENNLLKGILYGLYELEQDKTPANIFVEIDRDTLLYLLDVLGNSFGFDSPEKMILDVAYSVREENGNLPSNIILRTGAQLIPQSSKIKSDLVCDLSELLKDSDFDHLHDQCLEDTVSIVHEINIKAISPEAQEIVPYLGFSALMQLKWYERVPEYLEGFIYPNVKDRTLKNKIKEMLEEMNTHS